jgi:hypothetical protein
MCRVIDCGGAVFSDPFVPLVTGMARRTRVAQALPLPVGDRASQRELIAYEQFKA